MPEIELPKNFPQNICAYCGSKENLTRDHIPPKNLFPKPRPSTIITVPACKDCVSRTSKDDEYFRLKICMRDDAYRHHAARIISNSVRNSLLRKQSSGLRTQFFLDFKYLNLKTKSGLYVGRRLAYNVDLTRIQKVVGRITRALYFAETGQPLGYMNEVRVYTVEELEAQPKEVIKELVDKILSPIMSKEPKIVGNDIFLYRHQTFPDKPSISVWVISFYKQVPFFIITGPRQNINI